MSKILILAGIFIMIGTSLSYYNESFDGYQFIMPDVIMESSEPMQLSFSDAQQWCTKNILGSTLATVPNGYVQQNISDFIKSALRNKSHVDRRRYDYIRLNGKFHITNEWSWVTGRPKSAGMTVYERNDELYSSYARLFTTNFSIHSETSNKTGRSICEFPGNSKQCRDLSNERCHKTQISPLTWSEARNRCLHRGGDLASFESLSDANINALLRNLSLDSNTYYWIGLQKNEWRWIDTGSPMKYTNWEVHRPSNYSQRCLCITRVLRDWKECDCSEPYPFICLLNDTRDSPTPKPLSDISATAKFVVIIACCAIIFIIIVVIIVVAALTTKKRGNSDAPRSAKSSSYENPEYAATDATKDFSVYAEIQEPYETNSASNTTYAKVEMAENTYVEHPVNGIVYAELDLTSRP